MHLNPFQPNILQDMLSNRDLRSRAHNGMLCAKRHVEPKRVYPYSNTRQNERQDRKLKRHHTRFLQRMFPR